MNPQGYSFTDEDRMNPIYCVGCRSHIPRTVSSANRGLCPVCIAKLQAPTPPPASAPPVQGLQSQAPPQMPPNRGAGYVPPPGLPPPSPSKPMSPIALTLVVSAIAMFVILVPVISIGNARRAEAERAEQAQRAAEQQAEFRRKEEQRIASDPKEQARRRQESEAAQAKAAEDAQMRAEVAKRGVRPIPSPWDGITAEANAYLKRNLKDYRSMELIECSDAITWGENAWAQRVKYRAKNSFGGYVIENQIFVIKDGRVIDVLAN